jgi:dephospho-CoA kinase
VTANRRLRIGLTGGIGSGKSTVSALLAELGAAVVDTDLIARRLSGPGGAAIPDIAAAFGVQVITADGALDRERMRALVFSDLTARLRLESILHPLISAEAERQGADTTAPATVFDVPLLVESRRWPALVDVVWVVDCEESIQRMRVMARSGWSQPTVERVISQQVTRPARRAHADAVIYNGDVELRDLSRHVKALWSRCTRQPE